MTTNDFFRNTAIDFNGDISQSLDDLGLNWKPAVSSIRYGGLFENVLDTQKVLYRPEDGMFIDIVPDGWHDSEEGSFHSIIETFKEFCDAAGIEMSHIGKTQRIVGKAGQDGRLQLGLYAVAQLSSNNKYELSVGDEVKSQVILRYPYSYGKGIEAALNSVRLVCTNGMTRKVRVAGNIIRHNSSAMAKVEKTLAEMQKIFLKEKQDAEVMAGTQVSNKVVVAKLIEQFGDATKLPTDQPKIVNELLDRWDSGNYIGSELDTSNRTAWGLVNLVTEYYNHRYGRSQSNDIVAERLIDSTSAVNRQQIAFLESISGFAYAQQSRNGAVHVPVAVGIR